MDDDAPPDPATQPMKRRRVLHVLKYYRPDFTGEGVFLERSSAAMQVLAPDVEHDVLVTVTPKPDRPPPVCSTLANVFYLTDKPRGTWRHEAALSWWFVQNIWRYQTVHVRTHADWYFLSYMLAKATGRRLILSATLDDSVPVLIGQYRKRLRRITRFLFGLFDGFVSVSPKLQAQTSTLYPESRCHMIPYGITFPRLAPDAGARVRRQFGIPEHALVLVFVGGLCERKDPMLLVRHMPAVLAEHPEARLLLVGPILEPAYVADIKAFIETHNLQDHVVFAGEVLDPHPYYAAADIMTFGSHREGFGMVVPEAQANSLPVIVRHLPGVNDLFVKDGDTGVFFTTDEEYERALLRMAGDEPTRRAMGQRARVFVEKTFGMEAVARRYLDLYGVPRNIEGREPSTPAATAAPPCTAASARRPAITSADFAMTASVVNRRMHTPADTSGFTRPVLLTMIDAEEAFDWSAPFSRASVDVSSMQHQEPSLRIFERFGVVPTFLVDYPVATQAAGYGPLREWVRDGRCDVGTQLHPWVTPPFREKVTNRNSYPGNLPPVLEFEKIRGATEAIEANIGARPLIYRAGRYGVGPRTADFLKLLGYHADSSALPGWNLTNHEGPDQSHLTVQPYWVDNECQLLEIPSSTTTVGGLAEFGPLRRAALSPWSERLGVPSLTARLGLVERIKLTPEGITLEEAKRLVHYMVARQHKVFVLTYHTPSLVPGNTPYVRNAGDLAKFLRWLEEFYAFFTEEIDGRCSTWQDVRSTVLRTKKSKVAAEV